MKYTILILIVTLVSCSEAPAVKVNTDSIAIREYLSDKIHDLNSYQPVSYLVVDSTDKQKIVEHEFRAKNGFGADRLATWYFRINARSGKVTASKDEGEYLFINPKQWTDYNDSITADRMVDSIDASTDALIAHMEHENDSISRVDSIMKAEGLKK
jgi:hypothetical protein